MFSASDLNQNHLPRCCEVLSYLLYLRKYGIERISKNNKFSDYFTHAISKICQLWEVLNIPIISKTSIRRFLTKLVEEYSKLSKCRENYHECYWNKLFLIAKCKCEIDLKKNVPVYQNIKYHRMLSSFS